jgi:S1-C subfamily serine protease
MKRIAPLFVVLCACATTYKHPLPEVAPLGAAPAPEVFKLSDKARQTKLATIVFDLPMGHRYGESAWGFHGNCSKKEPLVNTDGPFNLDTKKYSDVFSAAMKRHGYAVESEVELFKDSLERVADLQVGARIVAATVNECYPNVSDNKLKVVGNAYLKIEWSVYSILEKKVLFTTTTEGSTYTDIESAMGQAGLLRPALSDAAEKLAMNRGYREVIDPPTAVAEAVKTARLKIKRVKEFTGDVKSNIESIRRAVATVTANKRSGSGFVISAEGAVLTAEHVVSGSKYVKVRTATGKECYGEVFAANKKRDLAIIRLDCSGLAVLPLGREKITEGGEVFAIGTPLSEAFQFSVTKGIVSGMRKIDEQSYIQSDVTVLPGNSGGPLLDSRGNAVGVTAGGIAIAAVPVGMNFFVPLADMDKYLPVDLE